MHILDNVRTFADFGGKICESVNLGHVFDFVDLIFL